MTNVKRRKFIETIAVTGLCLYTGAVSAETTSKPSAEATSATYEPCFGTEGQPEVGTVYPGWKEGEMDLNFIFTGVGESGFHILPDGTTMLVDAGCRHAKGYSKNVTIMPDDSRMAGEWIARYILRTNPNKNQVDYMILSHYHDDHCGGEHSPGTKLTTDRTPNYYLSGLAQVGEYINFTTVFDRGYPDYNQPVPVDSHEYRNFRKFLQYKSSRGELAQERFVVGQRDQITLRKKPAEYADSFHIQNICANGEIWAGTGTETTTATRNIYQLYPENKRTHLNENMVSLGFRVDYGPFRFHTAGDISGVFIDDKGQRQNIEAEVGKAVGMVDVCKVNHHSYLDAMVAGFVQSVQARVYVINVWDQLHIQDNTMTNMNDESLYAGPRLVCPTMMPPQRRSLYADRPWMTNVAGDCGHVVVKVFPGGEKYKVYYLSAEDESMRIKAVYGPFDTKKKNA